MEIRMTNEAKTGVLVLVCAVALGALLLKVGNFSLMQKGYHVTSRFGFTAGVKAHAPVRLSGVDVGEVKDIRLVYGDTTAIELVLWLKDGVKLRADSKAYVTTLGMMGEKYIEIKAGTKATPYVSDGGSILAEDPLRLEDLLAVATDVAEDISQMANDISALTKRIDKAVVDNRPRLDHMFENFEETSVNFKDFSQDIKYHPWKVLMKGKEKSKEEMDKDTAKRMADKKNREK